MTEEETRKSIRSQLQMKDSRREIIESLQTKGIEKETIIQWIKEESDALMQSKVIESKKNQKGSKSIALIIMALGLAGSYYCLTASSGHIVISGLFVAMILYGVFTLCM